MRRLNTFGLTLAVTAGLAAPAAAQTGSVTSLPGVGVVSNTATGTGTSATGTPGGVTSGGIQTATSTLGDPTLSSTPQIGALAGPGVVPQAISPSNILGGYYANAYYQGVPSATARAPGGFGVPLFGTAGLTGGGIIGTQTGLNSGLNSGLVGAATARPGATGGRAGQQGGFGGQQGGLGGATNTQSAVVIPLPRQISYTATLNFRAPVATMPEVATGLRTTLAESSMLTNPAGIGLAMDGNTVVLSGTVPTDDEARLVEGMVRLTPGVRDVRNELKVLPPSP